MQVIIAGEPLPYGLRLAAYAPNGARLGVLGQHLAFEAAMPLNDVSSLRLTYSGLAQGATWLASPCEVAIEYSTGGAWTEPANARFLRIKRSGEDTDPSGARAYQMPGYAWMLTKLILYAGASGGLVDGKRQFAAATPGDILAAFVEEGQARGALPGLSMDFTRTHDSAGQPWNKTLTISLDVGANLQAVLINLAEQGVLDWQMSGRTLQAYNEGTALARHLAAGPAPVDLRLGRDVDQAPDEATLEDASSVILIAGEDNLRVEVTNPAATAPWGRWETFQSMGGVSDHGTATLLGQHALARVARERVQLTRQVTFEAARWLPLADYRSGDHVLAPGDNAAMQDLRIRQITLSCGADGVLGGNLVLNDRFLERSIRLARAQNGILNGGIGSGGSGSNPGPDGTGRVPAAADGLVVEPDVYLDEHGWPRGQITATWAPVTTDVAGQPLGVDGYELIAQTPPGSGQPLVIVTTDSTDQNATYSPLIAGQAYRLWVRATNEGVKGVLSPAVTVTIPNDTVPPPVPSTAAVASRLGVIHVAWDGKGSAGEPMPADFERAHVYMRDPLNAADAGARAGYLTGAGVEVIPGQPYNADREVWLTAADRLGNESAGSARVTVATKPLVDTDMIGQVIDGASHIIDGTIPGEAKITADSITGRLIRALAIEAGHITANAITADKIVAGAITAAHISANAITADKIAANAITAAKIAADAINGKTITGSIVRSAATGQRFVLDSATLDLRFYPAGNANYSRLYAEDGWYPGETTTFITSGTNQSGSARAELQVAAGLVRLGIRQPSSSARKGGGLDVAESYGRFGYDDGAPSSASYIHCNSTGRWYLRGRVWDTNSADPYDTVHAGSGTVPPDSGGVTIFYGASMASNMGAGRHRPRRCGEPELLLVPRSQQPNQLLLRLVHRRRRLVRQGLLLVVTPPLINNERGPLIMADIWTVWDAELGYSPTSLLQEDGARAEQHPLHDGAEPIWGVACVRADGVPHTMIIPHSTWEWRAAQYGIDPEDLDTLLDVVLHEPWIPDPNDALARLNPAAIAQLEATHGLPTCWTPDVSDSDRLAAHQARIRAVKQHRVQVQPEQREIRQGVLDYAGLHMSVPADPLEPIKTTVRLDPARVQARRLAVEWYRGNQAAPITPTYAVKPPATWMGRKPWTVQGG